MKMSMLASRIIQISSNVPVWRLGLFSIIRSLLILNNKTLIENGDDL
jgi:hypothetical protein